MNAMQSLMVAAGLLVGASTASAAKAPDAIERVAREDLKAQIKSVDLDQKTFSVESEGREVTFSFGEKTRFMLDGKPSTAEHVLTVGSTVSIAHEGTQAGKVEGRSQG